MKLKQINQLMIILIVTTLSSCQTAYYAAWEKMGKEKRHLLKENINGVSQEQQAVSEEFKTALERIKSMYGYDGGELESFYKALSKDYNRCQDRSEAVSDRARKVERIAADLFKEWEAEIEQMDNAKLKTRSQKSLDDTRLRYADLHRKIVTAEAKIPPILTGLYDYVLYLKHNLNAQAIGSLEGEARDIETDVERLIKEINASVKAAEAFVNRLN